jgi:NADPH-dependent 2,4-dienoyl-CoA reductase/sulfur reductase-like enzyme
VLIIGGGAAGEIAAETLRQEGYGGPITILSNDDAPPVDRPNLSKDYLAGDAPEDWLPLRGDDWYRDNAIELRLKCEVAAIQPDRHEVRLADGQALSYGALLLATGSEPVRLDIPGADKLRYLRTLSDCRAIIERAPKGGRAVVLGASFIGLEVAASLRKRGLDVDVVAPDKVPFERVLGAEIGRRIAGVHEAHGARFHLGLTATAIEDKAVVLSNGERLAADLVVAGIGVRPRISLAEAAGLEIDKGVVVDSRLRTNAPDVWAAGDIARWPDPHTGRPIRVEHWVLAQRQGQAAARNILGADEPFEAAPFFWSLHHDLNVHYVGHAETWDRVEIDGDIEAGDCRVAYFEGPLKTAVVTIRRDLESLKAEVELEAIRA